MNSNIIDTKNDMNLELDTIKKDNKMDIDNHLIIIILIHINQIPNLK